ncbi:hypothetical protein RB608_18185 [Nocardioides sp. LHD-245]|uniref:hypothetical protein n=1 Tax=Nocardioides sp. LHD-245 TaxID=3051387 RepID=UPI0027E0BBD2|nr:hypothetical protein [Nocardioides sp. LHD-245]
MDDFSRGSRFLDTAVGLLLAAMALYGAVLILQAIWAWLCVGLAVCGILAAIALLIRREYRRW